MSTLAMLPPTERWAPIVGFEGLYEVSDQGRVRSLDRWVNGRPGTARTIQGVMLKPKRYKDGYTRANLYRDGVQHTRAVHRLVATAFIPNPDGKPEVNHIDGRENHATNLEWTTQQENRDHAARQMRFPGKLSATQVAELREEWPKTARGQKGALAARFGIGARHAWKVGTRRAHRLIGADQ